MDSLMSPDALMTALVVGPISGLVVLLVTKALSARGDEAAAKKTEAEADGIVQAGYEKYISHLEKRLDAVESRVGTLEQALDASKAQVKGLTRLLRVTVRWALTLRDELIRMGGAVPDMPAELDIALTTLDTAE